ncbi:AraC family transcriptional regulator [Clostridium sp. 'White wine YQ']|uniref:AraC family transcriptional regulator n=1 Tax=Clostridium sp. 'White wine YQ' TaxID=3027474 RepID=UPI0023655E48|nr:AraC family transcriptional regulator [Clostridium sp. 'White wine YQ']MDD7794395.1 AraC family transcriptional regulator [Clostridium sp. 'White wine YQ']
MNMEETHTSPSVDAKNDMLCQNLLSQIITIIDRITCDEGNTKTVIPFLTINRHTYSSPLTPSVLTPSFCIIIQGMKEIHLGNEMFYYYAGDYLASLIDMPASGQVVNASVDSPFIGLRIDFTTKEIASVAMEIEMDVKQNRKKSSAGAFVGKSDAELLDLFIRLLKLIENPKGISFLSENIKRELIFRLLTGDYGHLFYQQALFEQQTDGIGKAITWISENYSKSFNVKELAKSNNMSVSALQHKFKAITTMGPLQYQKQLRLQEARRLMFSGTMDATSAAMEVGYGSLSQFNREYKRLFGLPPKKDIKWLMENYELFVEN